MRPTHKRERNFGNYGGSGAPTARYFYQARLSERRRQPAPRASCTHKWWYNTFDQGQWSSCTSGFAINPSFAQSFFSRGGKLTSDTEVFDGGDFRLGPFDEPMDELLGQNVAVSDCPWATEHTPPGPGQSPNGLNEWRERKACPSNRHRWRRAATSQPCAGRR